MLHYNTSCFIACFSSPVAREHWKRILLSFIPQSLQPSATCTSTRWVAELRLIFSISSTYISWQLLVFSLSHTVSLFLTLSLFLSLCLSYSLSLSICLYASLSLPFSLCVCVSLFPFLKGLYKDTVKMIYSDCGITLSFFVFLCWCNTSNGMHNWN